MTGKSKWWRSIDIVQGLIKEKGINNKIMRKEIVIRLYKERDFKPAMVNGYVGHILQQLVLAGVIERVAVGQYLINNYNFSEVLWDWQKNR